jgi:ubiquinone biosynthesis protein UbiJ
MTRLARNAANTGQDARSLSVGASKAAQMREQARRQEAEAIARWAIEDPLKHPQALLLARLIVSIEQIEAQLEHLNERLIQLGP